jgi:phosphoglycolate phosphatase-like HAD superfamily hydrolase
MNRPVIALDADGVLVNYNLAYAGAWERAFGVYPVERDPHAYWAIDRWGVERLEGERLQQLRDCLDEAFWSGMEAMPQAVEACHALHDAGYELVCVSALQGRYAQARERNLRALGFPIDRIVATGSMHEGRSPKADAVAALKPVAFVDDYLPYFTGVEGSVHKALVMRGKTGSPNQGEGLGMIHSQHADLADFAAWWLNESGKHRE